MSCKQQPVILQDFAGISIQLIFLKIKPKKLNSLLLIFSPLFKITVFVFF